MIKYISIFRLVLRRLLVARKENSTGFSTGLTGRSKNLDPTGFHLCCVNPPLVSQNYNYLPPLLSACKTKGMVDQKWKWIADCIDCANDNSFSVEKIKLNCFNLKFISKKHGDCYSKEQSKTGCGPCKTVNSANS